MGYTHYWHRPQRISDEHWQSIWRDFEALILPLSDEGVDLAGGLGEGPPEINGEVIGFNGPRECGHAKNEELVIPYPSHLAKGIGPNSSAIDGDFYGLGVTVRHRSCNGSCSFETFWFPKSMELSSHNRPDATGLYIDYVKTGFRPYDVAVTAALIVAKHYLRDQFVVNSNGADAQWLDAREICQRVLGYGEWLGIVEERFVEIWPEEREVNLRTLVEMPPPEI